MFLFLLVLLSSCSSQDASPTYEIVAIAGRETTQPIYRIKMPLHWIKEAPPNPTTLSDTTKSIYEFFIKEDLQQIRITIHNFPSNSIEERIPPQAQLSRWKRQLNLKDTTSIAVKPQSFSGYIGLLLEADELLGWSLQLAPEHYRTLNLDSNPIHKQMRADITIKATGPQNLMKKYRKEIIHFARSFELIEEIPSRS